MITVENQNEFVANIGLDCVWDDPLVSDPHAPRTDANDVSEPFAVYFRNFLFPALMQISPQECNSDSIGSRFTEFWYSVVQ